MSTDGKLIYEKHFDKIHFMLPEEMAKSPVNAPNVQRGYRFSAVLLRLLSAGE